MKLEAMNISFQYDNGNRKILNNVSISLESGERVGLTAPSGFGKTTFCKILAGYEKPDHGTVVLDGKNISSCAGYNPVQMIWQHPELSVNPRLKMREVLREGDFVEERVVRGLGIEPDWLNRYPGELSGGELQRFCIARALGKRTRFILADEISTNAGPYHPEPDLGISFGGSEDAGPGPAGGQPFRGAAGACLRQGG